MSKVNDAAPARTPDIERWLAENLQDQERRHAQIAATMVALSTARDRWIEEFFARLQTTGYNVSGDQKRQVSPTELPKKPERPFKVTY